MSETERSDRKTAGVAEWQTHKTQNLAEVTSCGFKSHYPHSKSPVKSRGLTIRDIYFSYYFCYYGFVRSKCFFLYSSSTFHEFALFFHGTHIVCIIFFIYFFRMTQQRHCYCSRYTGTFHIRIQCSSDSMDTFLVMEFCSQPEHIRE